MTNNNNFTTTHNQITNMIKQLKQMKKENRDEIFREYTVNIIDYLVEADNVINKYNLKFGDETDVY